MRPVALFSFLLTFPALAAPAASPATTRAAEDGSGPRAALLLYDKLVGPKEAEKAAGLYHATTTRERAMAAALAEVDGGLADLHHAAREKWGRGAADELVRVLDGVTAADINAAKIEVDGDRAAVTFPASNSPTVMVRVGDEWRISVKALLQKMRASPRALRRGLAKVAAAASNAAAKIRQGQYATPAAVKGQLEKEYRRAFGAAEE